MRRSPLAFTLLCSALTACDPRGEAGAPASAAASGSAARATSSASAPRAASAAASAAPEKPARELRFTLPPDPQPTFVTGEDEQTSVVSFWDEDQTVITVELFPGAACAPFLDKTPEPQFPKMEKTRIGEQDALYIEGWAKTDSGKKGTASYLLCTSGGPAQVTFMALKREAVADADRARLLAVAKSLAVAPDPAPLPASWAPFESPDKKFAVALPGAPEQITDPLGGTVTAAKIESGALTVRCFELEGGARAQGEGFMGWRKGSIGDSTLVREDKLLRLDGHGVEIAATLSSPKPLELYLRVLRAGRRTCSFSALVPVGHGLDAALRAFLDSAVLR